MEKLQVMRVNLAEECEGCARWARAAEDAADTIVRLSEELRIARQERDQARQGFVRLVAETNPNFDQRLAEARARTTEAT